MQLKVLRASTPPSEIPSESTICHDVRRPIDGSAMAVRKGERLVAADIVDLLNQGVSEVHVAVPAADDLNENEAATCLARAVAGQGTVASRAHFGQVTLTSAARGLLRVRQERLGRANERAGVLVATGLPDCAVEAGTPVAVVKCAALYLDRAVVGAVVAGGPIIVVEPFTPLRVGLVVPGARLRGSALNRATASLDRAVTWFGGSLGPVVRVESVAESVADGFREARAAGAEIVLAAGGVATDPLDLLFDGLRLAGGIVAGIGMPIEPGTACWFGQIDAMPVLGLASCELFGRPGALDLLLPRLFCGERLDATLVHRLALGGLLVDGPSRLMPYHGTDDA